MAIVWDVDGIIITPEMQDIIDDEVALSDGLLNTVSGMRVFVRVLKASRYYDEQVAKTLHQLHEGPVALSPL